MFELTLYKKEATVKRLNFFDIFVLSLMSYVRLSLKDKQNNTHAPRVYRKHIMSNDNDCACVTLASILR